MEKDQRTSTTEIVSDGLAELLGRMVKDAAKKYRGGTAKAELAKGHPDFIERFHRLLDDLAKEQAIRLPIIERPAWKTIQLGAHKDADTYRAALKQSGFRIGNWANDILGKPAFTVSEPTEIDLVIVSVAELGFPNGAPRQKIYDKAESLGLSRCPAEVGPALRLQYPDQPNGEWLLIGMEPISDSDGILRVFNVGHDDYDQWLSSNFGDSSYFWLGDDRWVFVRRK